MANRIKELRLRRDLSQLQLGELANTSAQQIGKLEKGDRRLSQDWMTRIATALAVAPTELLPDSMREPETPFGRAAADLPLVANPFVRGLVETLPLPGSVWPESERAKWLAAAAKVLDLLYREESPRADPRGSDGPALGAKPLRRVAG